MRYIVKIKVAGGEEIKIHEAWSIKETVEVVDNLLFMSKVEEVRITIDEGG